MFFQVNAVKQIPPAKNEDLLLSYNRQTTRLDTRAKESAEVVRRYEQQHESQSLIQKLAKLGYRYQRFYRTSKKRTYTESKKTRKTPHLMWKKQTGDVAVMLRREMGPSYFVQDCLGTNIYFFSPRLAKL